MLDKLPDAAYNISMPKSFFILLATAILMQSMLGSFAAAGAICLGGGHDHSQETTASSCALSCSHAVSTGVMPTAVEDVHDDCGCVDIELAFDDFLSILPRVDSTLTPAAMPARIEILLYADREVATNYLIQIGPKWFDPSGTERVARLSTTCLIV